MTRRTSFADRSIRSVVDDDDSEEFDKVRRARGSDPERGVVGRPLLVVNGDGAVIGVIDEAELYRGMLREAVVQTPGHDSELEQSVAAQA